MANDVYFLGDSMEDQFWSFAFEMYFLGLGLFVGTLTGMAWADLKPDPK